MLIACALVADAAPGQFRQYTPPGTLAQPVIETEESLQEIMERARWRFGRLRVDPVVFLRNVEVYDNLFSFTGTPQEASDVRASAGAGLTAYLPVGPKAVATASALPEYVYWREQTELRRLIGRYEAAIHGYFNRLTLSASAHRFEEERVLNAELETPIQWVEEEALFRFELELGPFVGLFGSVSDVSVELPTASTPEIESLNLSRLDRRTTSYRLGVRYRRDPLELGLGVEVWETEFELDPSSRSNSGVGPILEAALSGERLRVGARISRREVEFETGSGLGDRTRTDGVANATVEIHRRADLTAYGSRSLVYSALDTDNYFVDRRWGAALAFQVAPRIDVSLFAEAGDLTYEQFDASGSRRVDDYDGLGARLVYRITDNLRFEFGLAERTFDSTLPEQDRTIRSGGGALRLGGDRFSW